MLARILQAAPDVKFIVTSRTRLSLQWEQLFELRGLPYPAAAQALNELEHFEAVRLLVDRARRLQFEFAITADNASAITRLCQMVEGLPLALELIASLTRAKSCDVLVQELERDRTALASDLRDVPDRQRTLRAVFDQSWRILTSDEQTVLRQLVVFQDGFTAEAVHAIASADVEVLNRLCDHAIIYRVSDVRYAMHEVVHDFAREALIASGDAAGTCQRHAEFFTQFTERCGAQLLGPQAIEVFAQLHVEFGNVRAAWQWAIENRQGAWLDRMADTLTRYLDRYGLYRAGEALLTAAADDSSKARARLGGLLRLSGDYPRAQAILEEVLANQSDESDKAYCCLSLADALAAQDQQAEAIRLFEESLQLARQNARRAGDVIGAEQSRAYSRSLRRSRSG